jgi:hypothetical protein
LITTTARTGFWESRRPQIYLDPFARRSPVRWNMDCCMQQNGTWKGHPYDSRTAILALAAGVFLIGGLPATAKSNNANLIKMLDTDNDGTVDLAEAKKAASALFDRLERDKDGTLDKKELAGRLSAKECWLRPILTKTALSRRTSTLPLSSSVSAPPIQITMGPWMQRNCIPVPALRSFAYEIARDILGRAFKRIDRPNERPPSGGPLRGRRFRFQSA